MTRIFVRCGEWGDRYIIHFTIKNLDNCLAEQTIKLSLSSPNADSIGGDRAVLF
ncbi:hypothetical protein [Anabaena sp. CCY 9402-a]|uniref:hypothetical protein n=1 Tax=Anabaena sp. CCY 9402-a TaxID=3103867 RepID=UPI0039C6CC5D